MTESLGGRFAKLWTASTTSALGSGLATIAAPLYVAAHTKSPLIVAATSAAAWLPWLLFALPGGVLVDRVDRRRLMVAIDWSRVAVMAVLATVMLAGQSSVILLDVVLFLINTGEAGAADIEALGEDVRRRVQESQGVALEWEILRLGVPQTAEVGP